MKIVMIYGDSEREMNTSNWRVFIPARAINKLKGHEVKTFYCVEFAENKPEVQQACSEADFIMFERNLFGDHNTMLMYWKTRDKIVTANFDDAYDKMHVDNYTDKFWTEGKGKGIHSETKEEVEVNIKPHPLRQFKWGLRLCAAGFSPNRFLVEDWRGYTNMHYLANYPEVSRYQVEKPEHKGIIIGWGGSLSHVQSWGESDVIRALIKVIKERDNVRLMITGDRRVFDMVPLPEEKKIYQNFVPFDQWPKVVANFDIGLAPLAGEFDKRRSNIKPLEYCLMGIPFIASDNGAYDELRNYGKLVKNQYHLWKKAIVESIDNLEQERQLSMDVSKPWAESQDVDLHAEEIVSLFQKVIDEGYFE